MTSISKCLGGPQAARNVRTIGLIFALFCSARGATTNDTFTIRIDFPLLQCDKPPDQPSDPPKTYRLQIEILNLATNDQKTITLSCYIASPVSSNAASPVEWQHQYSLKSQAFMLPDGSTGLQLTTGIGEGSVQFLQGSRGRQYLDISGITLEPNSYRFSATLSHGFPEVHTTLLDKEFRVNTTTGFSEHFFMVRSPSVYEILTSPFATKDRALIAIILFLVATIIAALKKQAERAVDQLLDFLGRRGVRVLSVRRYTKVYRDHVIFSHRYLRLVGLNAAGTSRPLLEEVFISLRVSSYDHHRSDGESPPDSSTGNDFGTALKRYNRLVVLGGPGAGKTTTLSFAALKFAQQQGDEIFAIRDRLLPIFIPLRRVPSTNTSIIDDLTNSETQILPAELLKHCPSDFFRDAMTRGQCLVLLDGLDEVVDEHAQRNVSDKINLLVHQFPTNRYIVSCRVAGWRDLLNDFRILETQDLSRDETHRFVVAWHRAVITRSERNKLEVEIPDEERFEELWKSRWSTAVQMAIDVQSRILVNAIDDNKRVLAIASNPMLLSLICLVHLNRNALPRERAVLYSQCIDLLIDAWDRSRDLASPLNISVSQKEAVLRHLAMHFQLSGKGEATRNQVLALVETIAQDLKLSLSSRDLVDEIERRSGILVERSIDILGFSHLTLQEYLVSKHIQLNSDLRSLLIEHVDNQDWREVVLLYAGIVDDATDLLQDMIEGEVSVDRWLLAGHVLGESQRCRDEVAKQITNQLRSLFYHMTSQNELILSCLSAIAIDFVGDPKGERQQLSRELIGVVSARKPELTAAVAVLAKARVTKALPLIVGLLDDDSEATREQTVKAVTQFGNLALELISKRLRQEPSVPYPDAYFETLRRIDTTQSARLLCDCYGLWADPVLRRAISVALAQLFANQFVEKDLLSMQNENVEGFLVAPKAADENGWDYGPSASRTFRALESEIRSDLIGEMRHASGGISWETMSPRLFFPAMIAYLRDVDNELDDQGWHSLGYDAGTKQPSHAVLNQLSVALRKFDGSFSSSVRRHHKLGHLRSLERPEAKLVSWMSSCYLAAYFIIVTPVMIVGDIATIVSTVPWSNVTDALIAAYCIVQLAFFTVMIVYGGRHSVKSGSSRLAGALMPLDHVIRRLPYHTSLSPWMMLVSFLVVFTLFSPVALLAINGPVGADGTVLVGALAVALVLVWMSSCLYYRDGVMGADPLMRLLALHPGSRGVISFGEEMEHDSPWKGNIETPSSAAVA